MCGFSKTTWVLIIAVGVGLWMQFVKKGYLYQGKTDLSGKTVIVTGGNTGIGYESALGLVKRNAKVIIACRNEQKAQTAVENIKKESGKSNVGYIIVDFADMASIKSAARKALEQEERLDILVNNAATWPPGKTKDGFEMSFGVNHIGSFMFTNLLMPLMRKTSRNNPVRIINLTSSGYMGGTIDFDNLNPDLTSDSSFQDALLQYCNTKLMNIYFTSELDARLKEEFKGQNQAITTYSVHPGAIQSNLGVQTMDDWGALYHYFYKSLQILAFKPTVYGAQTTLYCCLEEGIEKHSGGYFANLKHTELWSHALDPEVGKKLWTVSEELSGVRWEN